MSLQRAAGTIATIASQGGSASVVALSYGERGESGELWKEPNQTVENVKRIRQEEAKTAAEAVGANFQCLDLGDYPLNMTESGIAQLVNIFQDFQPSIVITHSPVDPFNPDHPAASQMVQRARLLSTGAGVASAFQRITPPELYFFEPHQPELCDFKPNVFGIGQPTPKRTELPPGHPGVRIERDKFEVPHVTGDNLITDYDVVEK